MEKNFRLAIYFLFGMLFVNTLMLIPIRHNLTTMTKQIEELNLQLSKVVQVETEPENSTKPNENETQLNNEYKTDNALTIPNRILTSSDIERAERLALNAKNRYLSDSLVESYLNGDWDGYPFEKNGSTISLSTEGELLIDGFLASPSTIHPQHCLDFPKDMTCHDGLFLLGDGTYLIENNCIVKYKRGEKIPLSGGTLDWSGMDTKNYRPYDTYLYYDRYNDTIFVVASSIPYDFSNKKMIYNIGIYLYVIPDKTKSEIKFVDEITQLNKDDEGLFYADTSGDIFRCTKPNGNIKFLKSSDPDLKNSFSKLGIAAGEIEFDWWLAFNDGHPNARRAFPDGTFIRPIIKGHPIDDFNITVDYRYKNMYSSI